MDSEIGKGKEKQSRSVSQHPGKRLNTDRSLLPHIHTSLKYR